MDTESAATCDLLIYTLVLTLKSKGSDFEAILHLYFKYSTFHHDKEILFLRWWLLKVVFYMRYWILDWIWWFRSRAKSRSKSHLLRSMQNVAGQSSFEADIVNFFSLSRFLLPVSTQHSWAWVATRLVRMIELGLPWSKLHAHCLEISKLWGRACLAGNAATRTVYTFPQQALIDSKRVRARNVLTRSPNTDTISSVAFCCHICVELYDTPYTLECGMDYNYNYNPYVSIHMLNMTL